MKNFDPKIYEATVLLSNLCDGATTKDKVGFNDIDAGFGATLANKPIENWTMKMALAAYRMLHKYHRQLQQNGIEYSLIVAPIYDGEIENVAPGPDRRFKCRTVKDKIELRFPYDPYIIIAVKKIDGRKWNPTKKIWTVPNTDFAISAIEKIGFHISRLRQKEKIVIDKIPGIKKTLRQFQIEAVEFIESKGGKALIGDEMGLGKTLEALSWLVYKGKASLPCLVVCPASAKEAVWAKEIEESTSLTYFIASGRKPNLPEKPVDIIIINYEILSYWVDVLDPVTVIQDECHYTKNYKAKRTITMGEIVENSNNYIPMSGTPITNRPNEFFSVLSWLRPGIFNNHYLYGKEYCGATHNGHGWDYSGSSNSDKLNEVLKDVMIRRKKEDVLTELPAKILSVIPLTASDKYWKLEQAFFNELDLTDNRSALTEIEKQKQAAVLDKMDQALQWIEDFLDSDQKLVVFATHKFAINTLMEKFKNIAVKIDGSVAQNKRLGIINSFQNDDNVRLFVGNIQAAGVGITLTAASNVLFIEFPWTPGDLNQAEDRCHRIGQNYPVNIHYMILKNSIEETIIELLDSKRTVLNQVLDGEKVEESVNILQDLLRRI